MKIYKMYRTDRIGYDEHVGFVVVANSKIQALDTATKHYRYEWPKSDSLHNFVDHNVRDYRWKYMVVGESPRKRPTVILSSYNAG